MRNKRTLKKSVNMIGLPNKTMKNIVKSFLPFFAIAALLAACSSSGDVSCMPLPMRSRIDTLYIVNDPNAKVEVVFPQLVRRLNDMGYHVEVVEPGTAPDDGYALKYEIRFGKKLKTLDYVKLEVVHNKRVVGYVTSDSSDDHEKYNSYDARIKPLVDRLFQFAKPTIPVK
jgi:hypothetical protein